MPGLLAQGASPQQQPPQSAPQPRQQQPQAQPEQGDPRVNVDRQKGQEMYNAVVESALKYLYGPGLKQVEQALGQGDNIVERMGVVISTVMLTIQNALAAQGKTVPPGVMFQAGMELAKAVGEMAQEMGRLPQQGGADAIESAFMAAMGRFGQLVSDAAMTQEQRQRYAELIRTVRELKQQAGPRETQEPQRQEQGEPMGQEAREAPTARQPMQGGM